jgi:hypothetical protein
MSLGCGSSDAIAPTTPDMTQAFWQLRLNHHAVTLDVGTAPYDTVRLSAMPLSPTGKPLPTAITVTYSVVNNDTSVFVDSTGLVHAHTVKQGVKIAARATLQGVTLADTVRLNVTKLTTIPKLKSISIHPFVGDSAKVDASRIFTKALAARVLDSTDTQIPTIGTNAVAVAYSSSDTTVAKIDSTGLITPFRAGTTMLVAETEVYGIMKIDSLLFTVGPALIQQVIIQAFTPLGSQTPMSVFGKPVTIPVGGTVIWRNISGQPVDIIFDDSTQVQGITSAFRIFLYTVTPDGGGNIPTFPSPPATLVLYGLPYIHARLFPVAGTYTYHSQLYGTSGIVYVK